jgi:hypothetical protein
MELFRVRRWGGFGLSQGSHTNSFGGYLGEVREEGKSERAD